jgi:hypothetical protein
MKPQELLSGFLFERIAVEKVECVFDNSYFKQFRCRNNKDVLKALPQASAYIVLPKYNLDLLLAGIDFDDRPKANFEKELQNLYNKVDKIAKNKTIIFFPVQAIEHWLYILQFKMENPASTKNISDEVENTRRKDLKNKMYKPGVNKEELSEKLSLQGNIDWLITRSKSFKKFYQQTTDFLNLFVK